MGEVVGTAVVEIVPDTRGFDSSLKRGFSRAGRDSAREFGGSFKRQGLAIAAGGLAAFGLITLARNAVQLGKESVSLAVEQSAANALVAKSVRNAGAEMTIYGQSIEAALEAESRITGIADDELAPAFTRLVQVTKDSAAAFNLLQLAEDVSRQRKIGVTQAALSLAKAQGGQLSALRRIIPGLKAESAELSKQENIRRALAQVQQQFGGARIAFAGSDAGQLERFNVAIDELKETLGAELLPVLSRAAKSLADTFAKPETQAKIQTTKSTIKAFVGDVIDLGQAAASGIGDRLEFKAARIGADNIGRLATAVQTLDQRMQGLTKSEQERTRELTKFIQVTRAEEARFQGAADIAQPVAGNRPQGLGTVTGTRSTIDPSLSARIREAQALATATTADDLQFFRSRKQNIDEQISVLSGSERGKNDQARLLRLLGEQKRLDEGISSIEDAAQQARLDAAEERKRAAEERKQAAQDARELALQEKQEALQEKKDARERARGISEQRIQLRIQRAELTKSTADDKAAQRAAIRFYGQQAASFRKTGATARALDSESQKISARLALRGLGSKTAASGGGARTDFFKEAANQFRTFGSNIGRAGDPLSGQQARGQFAGLALDRRQNTANLIQDQLNEAVSQTDILRSIATLLRRESRSAEGSLPPRRVPPHATAMARDNARNQLAGR